MAGAAAALAAGTRAWLSFGNLAFFSFQVRDLERAAQVAAGSLILWGPEMTGGGHLPGGLYYWLMSLPLRAGLGWKGAWWLLSLLWVAAAGVFGAFLARRFGLRAALAASTLAFLPQPLLEYFLNVSASPLFLLLSLLGVIEAFAAATESARARSWALACGAAGLAIQLHFSAVAPLVAGLVLQAAGPAAGVRRLPFRALAFGAICFGAALAPFAIYLLSGAGLPAPGAAGSPSDALPSLLYLARDVARPGLLFETFRKFLSLVPLPLLAAGLAARGRPVEARTRVAALCAIVCFVPASYFFLRPIGLRYVLPFEACLLVLLAALIEPAIGARPRFFTAANLAALALVVAAFTGASAAAMLALIPLALAATLLVLVPRGSAAWPRAAFAAAAVTLLAQPALISIRSLRLPLFHAAEMEEMSERIFALTGWSYDQVRERVFYVDKQMELSPKMIYEGVAARGARQPAPTGAPDGFLATTQTVATQTPGAHQLAGWLARQPLQGDLKAALRDGTVILGEPVQHARLLLVPYRLAPGSRFPRGFGNGGYSYEDAGGETLAPGVTTTGKDSYRFTWRECDEPWCATAAEVHADRMGDRIRLDVKILGAPLAQASEWAGPGWTQAWIAPYVQAACDGGTHRETLLESVGINPAHSVEVSGMRQAYNSFLAPAEVRTEIPCRGELRSLEVGRQSTLLYTVAGIRTLQPAPLKAQVQR